MDYFLADLHNMDENIMTYEHRPFKSPVEMRETLISNWNSAVNSVDTVYLLGDIGKTEILSRLNGQLIIVSGNHDDPEQIKKDFPEIEINVHPIMVGGLWLSHEPIGFMPPECPYLNIHGHLHRFNYGLTKRRWSDGNRYFCVSAEQVGYTPISIEQIAEKLEYKQY